MGLIDLNVLEVLHLSFSCLTMSNVIKIKWCIFWWSFVVMGYLKQNKQLLSTLISRENLQRNVLFFFFLIFSFESRGGFGSGRSGFGEICCPFVENKFTDNPSANRPLIGSGRRIDWAGLAGGWSGLMGLQAGFFWTFFGLQVDFKNSVHIIVLDFFGPF